MLDMLLRLYLFLFIATVSGCATHPETVTVVHSSDTEDYTPVIRSILERYPKGDVTIRFEAGTYDFYPEKAFGEYICVSNNDNGYKRCAFLLDGMRRISIEGCGMKTRFLFHGGIVPFRVVRCEEVLFSGFSLDYDASFVFEGRVIANDPLSRSITLKLHAPEQFEIIDGEPHFKGYDWISPFGENILFDPKTRSPYYSAERYEHNPAFPMHAERLSDSIVRLSGYHAHDLPPIGSVYTDKGPHSTNRRYPGFSFYHTKAISLNDVTIHHTGGMALIAERCCDIACTDYRVMVESGSGRMVSASADATHFVGCGGGIRLASCRFESMLDDATNIHSTYMKVTDRLSEYRFGVRFGHFQQEGYDFAEMGDSLVFVNRADLSEIGCGKVRSVDRVNDDYYLIDTDFDMSAIPDTIQIAVDNRVSDVSVEIIGCTVRYNRARSLLISSPGDVLIEDCDLSSMMAGIRICGDANYWFESGRTRNIIIRNNRFGDMGSGGWSPQAVLQIDPVIPPHSRGRNHYYHSCVRFEGNRVETFDNQIIYALSVDSLVICDNRFIDSKRYPTRYDTLSVIDVQHCRNVVVGANDFSRWKKDATISLTDCPHQRMIGIDIPPVIENPNSYFYEN